MTTKTVCEFSKKGRLEGTKEEAKEGAKEARIKKISISYLQLGFSK